MAAPNPPVVAGQVAPVQSTPHAAPASRSATAADAQLAIVPVAGKRKRQGTHVVPVGAAAPDAPVVPAGGVPTSRPKVSGVKKPPGNKPAGKKAPVKKPTKKASLAAQTATMPTRRSTMVPQGRTRAMIRARLCACSPTRPSILTKRRSETTRTATGAWKTATGTDQTGKRYWQRIEDKFFQFMPRLSSTPTRTYRSLQGRWDVIKNACSRWTGCIEQVRNAPPSGTNIDDWDRIAMERYKQMPASKGNPFVLQHCYKLLEHSEKWKLREQEAPPSRHQFVQLDDDEEDDVLTAKRNKGRPEGTKMAKDKLKKQAEASSLRDKIDEMVKSKEHLVNKTLEAKMMMMEKKSQDKQARFEILREDAKRKAAVEERRARAEEKRAMAELIAEENKTMMMNPADMDEYTSGGTWRGWKSCKEEGKRLVLRRVVPVAVAVVAMLDLASIRIVTLLLACRVQ